MQRDGFRSLTADGLPVPGWLRWTGVVAVAGFIFYASVLDSPGSGLPPVGPFGLVGLDKWLHALGYGALAGALAVALAPGRVSLGRGSASAGGSASERTTAVVRGPARVAAFAVLLAVGYGVGMEFVQAPLPERYFSVADMAADAVGAFVAVLGWYLGLVFARRSGRKRPEADA